MSNSSALWSRTTELTSAIPSKHSAGSVLFFPNTKRQSTEYSIALRIDHVEEEGGDIVETLMWLGNDPWDEGNLAGSIDGCRDHHLNEKQVLGLSWQRFKPELQVNLSGSVTDGSALARNDAIGLVAIGPFGFRLVGGVKGRYGQLSTRFIDPTNWSSHEPTTRSPIIAREWLHDWQLILHGEEGDHVSRVLPFKRLKKLP
ncbi:MAG TPA: hypothetical protein PLN33_05050 [Hyphomonadaceae bacterium]|jgi:hypothetical protein|nr:hypothetical protein [Hyphomonadaceae bacterium]HPN05687.1 hypothetical protein [Hyphomonadaceae bacterium]